MMRCVMVLAGLGISAGACGDDENTGQLADAPSSSDARLTDAPVGDAAPDGGPLGVPVTVTVTLGGVASPGQTVYFQSHDSATTETVLTGADGNATAIVEAGGYVTVVKPKPPTETPATDPPSLSTFAGVKPGDHLFVDVPVEASGPAPVSFTISVPDEEGGFRYDLHSTCGSAVIGRGELPDGGNRRARRAKRAATTTAAVSTTVELRGCGGTADMLVTSVDSQGRPRGWMYRADVPVIADSTVDFVGEYAALEEQAFTYTVLRSTRVVGVGRELRTARGKLFSASNMQFLDGTMASLTLTLNVPTPPGVVAVTTSTARLNGGFSEEKVLEWGANNASYELDFTAVGLHTYSRPLHYDVPTHEIRWTDGAGGEAPQFAVASIRTLRLDREVKVGWIWDLAAPWTAPKVAYPTLPTTLFDFAARSTDELSVDRLTTAHVPGGYDAARPRVFVGDLDGAIAGPIVGPTGRVVVENLSSGLDAVRATR